MAWVNPTSATDTAGTWTDDALSYDGNTGTFAYSTANNNTDALELNIAAISCDKIQIYGCQYKKSEADTGIVVDVYYSGGWHNIITATLTANAWTEGAIGSTQTVTAVRVTPSGLSAGNSMRLKALQFNELEDSLINGYFMQDGVKEEKFGYCMNSIEEFGYYMNSLV